MNLKVLMRKCVSIRSLQVISNFDLYIVNTIHTCSFICTLLKVLTLYNLHFSELNLSFMHIFLKIKLSHLPAYLISILTLHYKCKYIAYPHRNTYRTIFAGLFSGSSLISVFSDHVPAHIII